MRNRNQFLSCAGRFTVLAIAFTACLATAAAAAGRISPPVTAMGELSAATYTAQLSLPGQAHAAGLAGSFFRTTLWMTNPGTTDSRIRLRYVPASGQASGGTSSPIEMTIAPGGGFAYSDVLRDLFGATSDTSGVIVVEVDSGSPVPIASSRTFNDAGSAGTFGQYIPAVQVASGNTAPVWIHGLSGNAASRSNVGVVSLSASTITATLSVWDFHGVKRGNDVVVTVDPWSAVQKTRINVAAGAGELSPFSVRIDSPGPFFAYASKLDNETNDPIFVPAGLSAQSSQWIDGVASAAGAGGTYFQSNLSLTNPGITPANVTISFTRRGESAPLGSVVVTLGASESRFYSNAVREIFGFDGMAGSFAISTPASTPIVSWARTYNDLGVGGTFGQFIPGFGSFELLGSRGAIFLGVSENSSFRTNMGFVNVSTLPASATATLRASDGTLLGERRFDLAAGQSLFVSRVSNELGAASVSDATITVVPSVPGAIYAWASSVDNRSTDQTFFRPLALPDAIPELFTGTFSGTMGNITTPWGCRYRMLVSGTMSLTLIQNVDGSYSGSGSVPTSYDGQTTYTPPNWTCTTTDFAVIAEGGASGTNTNIVGEFSDNAANGRPTTISFSGTRSGNLITGFVTVTKKFRYSDGTNEHLPTLTATFPISLNKN